MTCLPLYTATLLLAIWIALGARRPAEDLEGGGAARNSPIEARSARALCKNHRWIQIRDWGINATRRARYNIHAQPPALAAKARTDRTAKGQWPKEAGTGSTTQVVDPVRISGHLLSSARVV